MEYQFIKTEARDHVLILTMHDPSTRNAMCPEMAEEMVDAMDRFEDAPDQRVLLLTGAEPSFCSGGNVRRFDQSIQRREEQSGEEAQPVALPWGKMEARLAQRRAKVDSSRQANRLPLRIQNLQKPSIAAVNGFAMGVGMGIALACDICYAAEKAVFSEAFSRVGLVPGDGSCWQLPRLIGVSNTLLLQYTGDRIDGNEAHRLGLVSKVLPDDSLMDGAMELALRLAAGPLVSLSLIKYLVHRSMETSLEESLEIADAVQEQARSTQDHKEAVQAFLEKRQPRFQGR